MKWALGAGHEVTRIPQSQMESVPSREPFDPTAVWGYPESGTSKSAGLSSLNDRGDQGVAAGPGRVSGLQEPEL